MNDSQPQPIARNFPWSLQLLKSDRSLTSKRSSKQSRPLWMLLPSLIILLGLQVYPMLASFSLALWRRQGGEQRFVGVKNFEILARSADTWQSVQNTLIYTGCYVSITLLLGTSMALVLHQRGRLTSLYLLILLIPWVVSDVVVGTIWRWMFLRDYGLIQEMLEPLVQRTLIADAVGAMAILVASSVWRSLAFVTLLLLAALQMVPREVSEHAALDGATRLQSLLLITLPMIRPQLLVLVLMLSLRAVNSVGLILAITSGGPGRATNTLSFYLYQTVWKFGDFGLGAALAVVMAGLNLLLTLIYLASLRTHPE